MLKMEGLFTNQRVNFSNISYISQHCSSDLNRSACHLTTTEENKRTVIAAIRLVVSVLSIAGSLSIIVSAIARKQVKSPKVFPIFLISIADGLLALTWGLGSIIWLSGPNAIEYRQWCFVPSLLTVMLMCITGNLTLVFAIGAYGSLKRKKLKTLLSLPRTSKGCKPSKMAVLYFLAWVLPVIALLVVFGTIVGVFHLLEGASSCSCWCVPYFGNILPLAFAADNNTAHFVSNVRHLVATYGLIIGTQYLVVFSLLVFFYWKILAWIRHMRKAHSGSTHYGSLNVLLMRGHTQARRRVIYFLSIFIITGLANVVLSYLFAAYEISRLQEGVPLVNSNKDHLVSWIMLIYVVQSLTAPLQGFLNAIVYGWTRDEFFEAITHKARINSEASRSRGEMIHSDVTTDPFSGYEEVEGTRSERRTRCNSDSEVFQHSIEK